MNAILIQKLNHISNMRDAVRRLWTAYNDLIQLNSEWDAQALGTAITVNDLVGSEHEGLSLNSLTGGYTTKTAIKALMDQGHASNICKLL